MTGVFSLVCWVNAVAIAEVDVTGLESPRWLRQITIARLVLGWRGLLLG